MGFNEVYKNIFSAFANARAVNPKLDTLRIPILSSGVFGGECAASVQYERDSEENVVKVPQVENGEIKRDPSGNVVMVPKEIKSKLPDNRKIQPLRNLTM